MNKIGMGGSCVVGKNMVGKEMTACETREFLGSSSDSWEITDFCLKNKIYLIYNMCINRNDHSGYYPSVSEWEHKIEMICQGLSARGGNKNNCRIKFLVQMKKVYNEWNYIENKSIINGHVIRYPSA